MPSRQALPNPQPAVEGMMDLAVKDLAVKDLAVKDLAVRCLALKAT